MGHIRGNYNTSIGFFFCYSFWGYLLSVLWQKCSTPINSNCSHHVQSTPLSNHHKHCNRTSTPWWCMLHFICLSRHSRLRLLPSIPFTGVKSTELQLQCLLSEKNILHHHLVHPRVVLNEATIKMCGKREYLILSDKCKIASLSQEMAQTKNDDNEDDGWIKRKRQSLQVLCVKRWQCICNRIVVGDALKRDI